MGSHRPPLCAGQLRGAGPRPTLLSVWKVKANILLGRSRCELFLWVWRQSTGSGLTSGLPLSKGTGEQDAFCGLAGKYLTSVTGVS